tara:strand:+ start:1653 stop:1913 length:261 start_codon:yes stop_codon:yes gene_type:complete
MKNPHSSNSVEHLIDGMTYLVARHFKISMAEVRLMSEKDFVDSFAWGSAAQRYEAEEMDKSTGDMKQGQRVAGTDAGRPFPGSKGW